MATYYKSTPTLDWSSDYQSSGGEKSFKTQLDEKQAEINSAQNAYNNYQSNVNAARNAYDEAYGNQTSYNDLYAQAEKTADVANAKEQYQKSLDAINATNAAMNRLPSSVNAQSNVVLNNNQRNAALSNQTSAYQNVLNDWVTQAAGDQSMYQTAIGQAQNLANANMDQQQKNIQNAMTRYQTEMSQLNQLYQQVINEKSLMQQIYGNMYNDKYNAYQTQLEAWADNLQAETTRYVQEQENYRAGLAHAAQMAEVNAQKEWQKYMQEADATANAKNNNANDLASLMMSLNGGGIIAPYKDAATSANPLALINKGISPYNAALLLGGNSKVGASSGAAGGAFNKLGL